MGVVIPFPKKSLETYADLLYQLYDFSVKYEAGTYTQDDCIQALAKYRKVFDLASSNDAKICALNNIMILEATIDLCFV